VEDGIEGWGAAVEELAVGFLISGLWTLVSRGTVVRMKRREEGLPSSRRLQYSFTITPTAVKRKRTPKASLSMNLSNAVSPPVLE